MKGELIKVSSISDVITNSSTEVFLNKDTEKFREFVDNLDYVDITYFETEEDVRKFIFENMWRIDEFDNFPCLKYNPLYGNEVSRYAYGVGKTDDELWAFVKDAYLSLIGYAYASYVDDCGSRAEYEDYNKLWNFTGKNEGYCDRI